jgi:hypothetical protein
LFTVFLHAGKGSPEKNTTKYGPNAKIPTKRTKKQDKEPQNRTEQAEQSKQAVQDEQADNDTAIVPFALEILVVVTSPTKPTMDTILQDSPIRLTRG